jgi:3-hydroxybutyryl-CoA dehydratase
MPYFLDELTVGQSESVSKTVTDDDLQKFGDVSLDHNPVHFDEAYAKGTMFGGRIAHGMLTASLFSGLLGMRLPGPGTIYLSQTLKFKAPVRLGETAVATITIKEIVPEKKRVILDCVCKVGDTVVLEGEAVVMAPVRPH